MAPAITLDARPLAELIDRFLDHVEVERGLAPNTKKAYQRDLALYRRFLEANETKIDAREIAEEEVERFIADLRTREYVPGKRYSATSVARALAAVRGFHRWLVADGQTDANPAEPVDPMRVPRSLPKALSRADIERLLSAVPEPGEGATPIARSALLRDRAMLEVLYAAGLRISELTALEVGDLDLDARTVRCFGKGSRERVVPIGRPAATAVERYLSQARGLLAARSKGGPSDRSLFLNQRGHRLTRQGSWKLLKRYAHAAGLADRVSPHTLRHSFATHLLDGGAQIREVQELLGHASVSTTQVYTLVSQEDLQTVYREAHPRAGRSPART